MTIEGCAHGPTSVTGGPSACPECKADRLRGEEQLAVVSEAAASLKAQLLQSATMLPGQIIYCQGIWRCQVKADYGDQVAYIPLEGYGPNQEGHTFTAAKNLFTMEPVNQIRAGSHHENARLSPLRQLEAEIVAVTRKYNEAMTIMSEWNNIDSAATVAENQSLRRQVEELAAKVARLRAEPAGWQPIETAPRMKNILLFAVTEPNNWKMDSGYYSEGSRCWIWSGYDVRPGMIQPTHWMPLPAPPEQGVSRSSRTIDYEP